MKLRQNTTTALRWIVNEPAKKLLTELRWHFSFRQHWQEL